MQQNDFRKNLDLSNTIEARRVFMQIYTEYANRLGARVANVVYYDDMETQRRGIDCVLELSNGQTIRVDEKIRTADYGDILLELDVNLSEGWYKKIRDNKSDTDLIAYLVCPYDIEDSYCVLIDCQHLRESANDNLIYGLSLDTIISETIRSGRTYITENKPIETNLFIEKLYAHSNTRIDEYFYNHMIGKYAESDVRDITDYVILDDLQSLHRAITNDMHRSGVA